MKSYQKLITLIAASVCASYALAKNSEQFSPTPEQVSQRLDWVSDDYSVCGGHYQDPLSAFTGTILPSLRDTPVEINTDQSAFRLDGSSIVSGKAAVEQPGRTVNADQIELTRNGQTGQITDATLKGNISLREPNKLVVGEQGHVDMTTRAAKLIKALYRVVVGSPNADANAANLSAWGRADTAEQQESGIITLQNATYTTCAPNKSVWQVSAKTIDLDRDTGRGTAHNAWLKLKGVPVFYAPYFNFPIDNRRQSGFLFPSLSASSLSGLGISLPFYWNIAPNYDAVITPVVFTKRGLQVNGLFRYLTYSGYGQVMAGYLPGDSAFNHLQNEGEKNFQGNPALGRLLNKSNNRSLFSWQDQHTLAPRWTTSVNFNYVSDDYYLQDFGGLNTLTPYQLPRQASINYTGNIWNFTGKINSYQTLHLINQTATSNPYASLPELDLNASLPNQAYGFNYQLNSQFVYFERAKNPGETISPPTAARIHIQPVVSLPITQLAGYITPTLKLDVTHYNIGQQLPGFSNDIQRIVPMFNVDSGLYFDRHIHLGQHDYQQTLEPRLFYLYVPYRNQNNIPIFDSSIIPFSYNTLFLTNRFSGLDRIGDANQVSFALTTRLLDAAGNEKFRASIGEIYYFRHREVGLCSPIDLQVNAGTGATCNNPNAIVGATSPTEKTSPIAGLLSYNFDPHWSTTANIAWDPYTHDTINAGLNLQYQPKTNHIVNVTYNYLRFGDPITTTPATPADSHRSDLNQAGVSFAWPIKESWQVVGGWNYNFARQYSQTYFYGLQYDSCCWAVRLVAGRSFYALNQNGNPVFNNAVYLQWQFKGLGTVGTSNPTALLTGSIPGYQDSFANNRLNYL